MDAEQCRGWASLTCLHAESAGANIVCVPCPYPPLLSPQAVGFDSKGSCTRLGGLKPQWVEIKDVRGIPGPRIRDMVTSGLDWV